MAGTSPSSTCGCRSRPFRWPANCPLARIGRQRGCPPRTGGFRPPPVPSPGHGAGPRPDTGPLPGEDPVVRDPAGPQRRGGRGQTPQTPSCLPSPSSDRIATASAWPSPRWACTRSAAPHPARRASRCKVAPDPGNGRSSAPDAAAYRNQSAAAIVSGSVGAVMPCCRCERVADHVQRRGRHHPAPGRQACRTPARTRVSNTGAGAVAGPTATLPSVSRTCCRATDRRCSRPGRPSRRTAARPGAGRRRPTRRSGHQPGTPAPGPRPPAVAPVCAAGSSSRSRADASPSAPGAEHFPRDWRRQLECHVAAKVGAAAHREEPKHAQRPS